MIRDKGDATPSFVIDLLKNTISTLENKLSKKDAIINFLPKQLVFYTGSNSDINNTSGNIEVIASNKGDVSKNLTMSREFADNLDSTETNSQRTEEKSVISDRNSMLNNIRNHGLSKQHSIKIKNFPGATTERINEEIDYILQTKTRSLNNSCRL